MPLVHKNCRLAYGATRIVLLVGPYAIKIPSILEWRLFLLGLLANMQERAFSKLGWPELCPIIGSVPGGWLVIMRRAREMTPDEFDLFRQFCEESEHDIPTEYKSTSFGWLDGKPVVIDYGN